MAINTLEYAKILQQKLDQKATEQLKTGFLDSNARQVKYNGGKEIKIPTISTTGLGNYNRDSGFTQGSATLTYATYTMTQDRGVKFQIDRQDVDETNFVATATNVMSTFQTEQVVPEIDAYRISKIYSAATTTNKVEGTSTVATTGIKDAVSKDIIKIRKQGYNGKLVMLCTFDVKEALESAIGQQLSTTNLKAGSYDQTLSMFNEVAIVPVGDNRMYSEIKLNDGKTGGQTSGGYTKATSAKNIDYIIFPMELPIAVTKQDTIKIFAPEINQTADAWLLNYRRYHDIFIPEQRKSLIVARGYKTT